MAGAQATATQAAPTVQALATQAAPPVQALATQVAPAVASAVALSPVQVVNAQVGTTDSTITLRNAGMSSVDLSGWTLRAGSTSVRVPGSPTVPPGGTITLHTGQATSTAGEVYLGQEGQMLAQALLPGATVLLVDPSGAIASQFMIPSR